MTTELVRFDFRGSQVQAFSDPDGGVWFAVRGPCERLGIDTFREAQRIKRQVWAVGHYREVTTGLGAQLFLSKSRVLQWANSIQTESVSQDRETLKFLADLQGEFAEALNRQFGLTASDPLLASLESTRNLTESAIRLRQEQIELAGKVGEIQARLDDRDRRAADAELHLYELPIPNARPLSLRAMINRAVRQYAEAYQVDHDQVYTALYRDLRDRYHVDLRQRRRGEETYIATAERCGQLEHLWELMKELARRPNGRQA